jgi:hypothetical protein
MAIKGNSAINNTGKSKQIVAIVYSLNNGLNGPVNISDQFEKFKRKCRGKNMKNKVLSGVGIPINLSDCRVSILNFAKRNREKKGIANAHKGRYLIEASKSFGIS